MDACTMQRGRIPLVVLCGPTAAGKTDLALRLAAELPVEIVSADSRQVYRGMDIGTAKATLAERRQVPHHLIDVVAPDQEFSAADFVRLGRQAIEAIVARDRLPLVVGGTGLYVQALTEGLLDAPGGADDLRRRLLAEEQAGGGGTLHRRLAAVDPELAARLAPRDLVRIVRALEVFLQTGSRLSALQQEHAFGERPYRTLKLALAPEREELYRRIDRRVELMMAAGLVDEVRGLLQQGYPATSKALQTIGYRECQRLLAGELTREEAVRLIQRDTRRYAKRQLTWLRKDKSIIWLDSLREFARILRLIEDFIAA